MLGSPAKWNLDDANPVSGCGQSQRFVPELKLVASVAIHLDASQSAGEAPDGVRLGLLVHGTVDGPMLKGTIPTLSASMLVDVDGIGTLVVRAPFLLNDGAVLEIEAIVRYDFGPDGYRKAAGGELPDSIVGGCLRFLTGHPRYQWVNRAVCLGVGKLSSQAKRIDYDVFVIEPKLSPAKSTMEASPAATNRTSLCDRLGGRSGISQIVDDFVNGFSSNAQLLRQNPRIALASGRLNRSKVTDFICKLTGGPCEYKGRSLKQVHAPLGITDADWAIGGAALTTALDNQHVKKADQAQFLAMVDRLKSDIVQG